MAQGRLEEAEQELVVAVDVAAEVGNPPQLWKTHAAMGDLRRAQGRTDDARRADGAALAVIEAMAAGIGDDRLRGTFLASPAVQTVRRANTP